MEPYRFDDLNGWQDVLHRMTQLRRALLSQALAAVIAWFAMTGIDAKSRRKHRKKPQRNAFGCVDVGDFCKRASQCCSGICKGQKGKKRCKAHDTGGCQPASLCSDVPEDDGIPCTTSSGAPGTCGTTTGNAGYCVGAGDCFACAKDADCQEICGPRAACIQCPEECSVRTVCAAPDGTVCPL